MKKFLILGNLNAVSYKGVFEAYKENKIWSGVSIYNSKNINFKYENRVMGVKAISWFTNFNNNRKKLLLKGTDKAIDKYDDYDAYNINRINDIFETDKLIGVPITIFCFDNNNFEVMHNLWTPYINNKKIYKRIIIKLK